MSCELVFSKQLPPSLVWFPLVVSEQRLTDRGELIDVDGMVPRRKEHSRINWNEIHIQSFKDFSLYLLVNRNIS